MQRTVPPRPLSLRSGSYHPNNHADSSLRTPQTPKNTIRTKRASKPHRPTPPETYPESNARGHPDGDTRDERISHDLSLTDDARHSVVDSMLLSLNPDPSKLFSSRDRPTFSSGSDSTAPPNSAHRHLHSSSVNSDFSFPADISPQRFSNHLPRGRRSNSSSNFQLGLGRIDSVHGEGENLNLTKAKTSKSSEGREAQAGKSQRPGKSRGKSSGSSSVDLGHMILPRIQRAHVRRSASFDLGERSRTLLDSVSSSTTHQPLSTTVSAPTVYDDIEAAPTPTVPAGPRKDRSTLFPPHTTPLAPTPQRRNSNKSSRTQLNRKRNNDLDIWDPPIPPPANTLVLGSRRASKQANLSTGYPRSRKPSPARQYSEPLMARKQEPTGSTKDQARDRPGFFRRVFGSSRSDVQSQLTRSTTRASSRDDSSHPTVDTAQPPLVKKHSSFFRRRKKSVSEMMPPPALPLKLYTNPPPIVDPAQRSPTSSLRQVMNPYLDDPVRSDARQFAGTDAHETALTMTYNLQAKGAVGPDGQDWYQRSNYSHLTHPPPDLAARRRELSARRSRLEFDGASANNPHDDTFLHDDSNDEIKKGLPGDEVPLTRNDTVRLDQAPISSPASRPSRKENTERPSKSRDRQAQLEGPISGNAPPPQRSTPTKPDPREWLTPSHVIPGKNQLSSPASEADSERMWLQPESFDKAAIKRETFLLAEDSKVSTEHHSAPSIHESLKVENDIHFPEPTAEDAIHKLSGEIDPDQPSEMDRVQAKQIFDGDETLTTKSLAAAWLGEPDPVRTRVRQAYMELFDWKNLNILAALRGLCGKLYLKGEAQQVDRILDSFSSRWCACNPEHGFKATDVVHTICYSILLLNTDLHQAEIETKMTRTQFLKNILPTIRRVVTDAAPDAFVNPRASTLPAVKPLVDPSRTSVKSPTFNEAPSPRRSFESQRPVYRLSQRPSDQMAYTSTAPQTPLDFSSSLGECGPLVKSPFHGRLSTWENQVEVVLKDFYSSIRQHSLSLHGAEAQEPAPETPQTSNSLSAMTSSMLRRTPSMLSKAGSENVSYSRGRPNDGRLGTGKWQSKNRSRPRLYPASSVATSRRSSFDEQSSVTSQSVTSAWSKFSSLGKTQTSLSIDSFASNYPQGDYQQSVGFANALSQAIIREEGTGSEEQSLHAAPLLEDESLELAGAPWAKEGNLKHKHHLEAVDKKSKDRNWVESFAVIEKGYMRLFSFSMNAKSLRNKARNQKTAGGVVGGGNWADSAETLGTFLLRQTIASALPPPGYSKARPHVWALSLPTGAVHLFQVGTPEIAQEFVSTANYWSARLSKEPMIGGISNIEYGWGESVINTALLNTDQQTSSSAMGNHGARPSLQSSIRSARSSVDQVSYRPRLPGDKIVITDWKPPQQSMVASVLMEVDQLKGLTTYVKNIEDELEKHNELRAAMLLAVSHAFISISIIATK